MQMPRVTTWPQRDFIIQKQPFPWDKTGDKQCFIELYSNKATMSVLESSLKACMNYAPVANKGLGAQGVKKKRGGKPCSFVFPFSYSREIGFSLQWVWFQTHASSNTLRKKAQRTRKNSRTLEITIQNNPERLSMLPDTVSILHFVR